MIMPPLPEPAHEQVEDYSGIAVNKTVVTPLFTSDQMLAYAEQAVAAEIERLREALTELRDRIKGHPAYADLTEEEEIETGGDTAELSYLARVADAAIGA